MGGNIGLMNVAGGANNNGKGSMSFMDMGGNIGTMNVQGGINNNKNGNVSFLI